MHLVRYPVWIGATATVDSVLRSGLELNPDVSVLGFHEEFRPNLAWPHLQKHEGKRGTPHASTIVAIVCLSPSGLGLLGQATLAIAIARKKRSGTKH